MTIIIDLSPTIQEVAVDLTPVTQAIAVNLTTTTQAIEVTLGVVGGGISQIEIKNEIPTGAINGVNATFTTAFAFIPESLQLFLNGIRQKQGTDFVNTNATTLVLSVSPETNDKLLVDYTRA